MANDHVLANIALWEEEDPQWVERGERMCASDPVWGIWEIPESEMRLLPDDMAGLVAVELGCGTAYVAGWMFRSGAKATGIDVLRRQLRSASMLARKHKASIGLILADAEAVPLPEESFDFAISEYGAALWCEPASWLSEAHRLLVPGGQLVFLSTSPWAAACYPLDGSTPAGTELVRPYFGMEKLDWTQVPVDPGGVEFVPTMTRWFQLFAQIGFHIDDYIEVRAPVEAEGPRFALDAPWAQRWPSEHVWKLTRKA